MDCSEEEESWRSVLERDFEEESPLALSGDLIFLWLSLLGDSRDPREKACPEEVAVVVEEEEEVMESEPPWFPEEVDADEEEEVYDDDDDDEPGAGEELTL